jgi:hypothetical protein
MKTNNLLGKANAKLIKTAEEFNVQIFNFSIPAGNDKKSGKITCPFAGSCFKLCYAKKGNYRFGNVQRGLTYRYETSKQENFVELMNKELSKIKKDKQTYIRIHDSGDFYSPSYFQKWLQIARLNPSIRFYAYTKSHSFIRGIQLPENFDLIFSLGSTKDELIDQEKERHSKIFYSSEEMEEQGYTDSSYFDLLATKWHTANNKIGLIIH